MHQHRFSRNRKSSEGRYNASKHTVFISDFSCSQSLYIIPVCLPVDYRIIIFLRNTVISKCRMLCSFNDFLYRRRYRWKVHIRDPHRNRIKPFSWCIRDKSGCCTKPVYCNCIFPMSVHYCCKIKFCHLSSYKNIQCI